MIDEQFLTTAVNIRRKYLKLSSNLDMYQRKAKDMLDVIDKTIKDIEDIKSKASSKSINGQEALREMLNVLNEIDDESKAMDNYINPLNLEIEKLALEEQELFRLIKVKHSDLEDDIIISCVKERLEKENLI